MVRTLFTFTSVMLAAAVAARAADNPSRNSAAKADGKDHAIARPGHLTVQQLVQQIKNKGNEPNISTRLTAGHADTEVTGIATTFVATLDVLRRAAASGRNLVVTHEPTFYKQSDKIGSPFENDKVLADKQAFIEEHGMAVWRFNNQRDAGQTDGIVHGLVRRLGWQSYLRPAAATIPAAVFNLPETTLQSLAGEMKEKLHASVVRVVGKRQMKVKTVAMIPGVGAFDPMTRVLQRDDVDVLVCGQTPEWQAVEYAQDAVAAGKPKALIMLGHVNSAEAGMENCADWLREFITEVPVEFLPAGDPFWSPPAAARVADPPQDPGEKFAGAGRPTARQLVERIQQNVHLDWSSRTVDTFKAGNPDAEVTGVATTFMSTLEMLERAAASGTNFVVSHEPTFYNHLDDQSLTPLENDKLVAEKLALIEKHGLIVWRFHDHWHARRPDGIVQGMVKGLGWEKYLRHGARPTFDLPETTLQNIAKEVRDRLHGTVIRVVGNPQMKIRTAGLEPGAGRPESHVGMLQRDDVQLLLTGETPEWLTVEYARDAVSSGRSKALIILGHANSEEAGMENCADWLREFMTEVPVRFIPSGDPFWSP